MKTRVVAAGVFGGLVGVLLFGRVSTHDRRPSLGELDREYVEAIERAVAAAPASDRERLRVMLEASIATWESKTKYQELRRRVEVLGIRDFVRLELGDPGYGSYKAYWYAEGRDVPFAFYAPADKGAIREVRVSVEKWNQVQGLARELPEAGCISDVQVRDGTSYFLTIARGGDTQISAAYGLILEALPEAGYCRQMLQTLMTLPDPAR